MADGILIQPDQLITIRAMSMPAFHNDDVTMPAKSRGPTTVPNGLSSVPVELLLQIFKYSSGNDTVNFLSTCKSYRPLVKNESIWFEFCCRYGVRDLPSSGFHNHTSFYTVYSELLHTYGPLLGLWASDAPFQGHVIEFRLVLDSKNVGWEGIICEAWDFSRGVDFLLGITNALNSPSNPHYREVLRIELLPPSTSQGSTTRRLTRFGDEASLPIQLLKPHAQVCYVLGGMPSDPLSLHPVFPPLHSQWIDTNGGVPGLKKIYQPPLDESSDQRRNGKLRFLPAPHDLPLPTEHSIVLRTRVEAPISSSLASRTQPHYYPLRSAPFVPVSNAQTWDPRTLAGIWLGSYSTHGTEVLRIVYDASSDWQLQAWKVTGDMNVPRGALSWKAKIPSDHSGERDIPVTADLIVDMSIEEGPERENVRMLVGKGTASPFGYR